MKDKLTKIAVSAFAFAALMLTGCIDNSDDSVGYIPVQIESQMPQQFPDAEIVSGKLVFRELNTSETTAVSLPQYSSYLLIPGLYDVEGTAVLAYVDNDGSRVVKDARATASSVVINSEVTVTLKWFFFNSDNTLLFGEIYFAGSMNATSTGGIRDTYFTIFNNTDEVIYADGIGIAESTLVNSKTNAFEILTPANDRNRNFTAGTVLVIPGSGKDVPVYPGESIKIVDQAIRWSDDISWALDHSDADFEWYDDNYQDVDNPSVPNLSKWYCYSLSIWIPSNQCNRSYALVRFPDGMTAERYLAEYHGAYEYISTIGTHMTNNKAYLIPNEWIIDGVNLSNREMWVYGALANAIDNGFASISDINKDPERFGRKFVRRTAAVTGDGRLILQDTNDSSVDFTLESVR